MNRVTLILLIAALFFANSFIACGEQWHVVFEGSSDEVNRVRPLLFRAGFSSIEVEESPGGNLAIKAKEREASALYIPLKQLRSILSTACRQENNLKEYFLPIADSAAGAPRESVSKIIKGLRDLPNVFSISCANLVEVNGVLGPKLTVWYTYSGENTLKELNDNVKDISEMLALNMTDRIIYKELPFPSDVLLQKDISDGDQSLIVFEPFSFRVLDSEKSVAGIQFLVMLVLFLISGFTLGYWWGKR